MQGAAAAVTGGQREHRLLNAAWYLFDELMNRFCTNNHMGKLSNY